MGPILGAVSAMVLALSLGAALSVPAFAEKHTLGDRLFNQRLEKSKDLDETNEALSDAAKDAKAKEDARNEAQKVKDNAESELRKAEEDLEKAKLDEDIVKSKKDPPSTREQKIEAQGKREKAEGDFNAADGPFNKAKEALNEAEKEYGEAQAEAERLEKKAKSLEQELEAIIKEQAAQKAKEGQATGDETPAAAGTPDKTATAIAGPAAASPVGQPTDKPVTLVGPQATREGAKKCVVDASKKEQDKVCGKYPEGTKILARTQGWYCADDKDWAEKMSEKLKKSTRREIETALRQGAGFFSTPGPIANKAAALGLKVPESHELTAGPDSHKWEPCYTDDDVKKIINEIDDAVKRAEPKPSSSGGG